MSFGIVLVMIQTYIHLRYKFRVMSGLRSEEPQAAQQVRQEIVAWEQAAMSLSSTSNDESLVRDRLENKIRQLKQQLKKQLTTGKVPNEVYEQTLSELQQKVMYRKCIRISEMLNFSLYSIVNHVSFSTVSDPKSSFIIKMFCGVGIRSNLLLLTFAARLQAIIARVSLTPKFHF